MEPEGSLLCSQDPTTGSHPELVESNPPHYFFKVYSDIMLQSKSTSPKWHRDNSTLFLQSHNIGCDSHMANSVDTSFFCGGSAPFGGGEG
jgi:hypothetical protein